MKKFAEMSHDDLDHLVTSVQRKLSKILPADAVAIVVLATKHSARRLIISQLDCFESAELLKQTAWELHQEAIESN